MRWDALERAIADEEWPEGLRLALEGWRAQRHPRYADLVEWLGARAAPFEHKGTDLAFHEAWLAAAETGEDIGPLLATLTTALPRTSTRYFGRSPRASADGARRHAGWLARVGALERRSDDPRVARALLDVLTAAPWTATWPEDAAAVAGPAVRLIARIGDPRTVPRMQALLDHPVAQRRVIRAFLAEALPAAISAIREVSLDDASRARVERILGTTPGPVATASDDELFALVVADVDRDAPRAVLADHWLERGDVRGELVARQLAGEPARGLSKKHDRAWLGELALVTKNRVYRRGFLAEIELQPWSVAAPAVWEAAVRARDMGTVEVVHQGHASEELYRVFLEAAPALRVLVAPSPGFAFAVAQRSRPWGIEHLALEHPVDEKIARTIAASASFPRLSAVSLGVTEGGAHELLQAARQFAARGVQRIRALPIELRSCAELTDFLAEPTAVAGATGTTGAGTGVERSIRTRAGGHIVARAGLRLEIECEYLHAVVDVLGALQRRGVPIAEVRLELPPGVKKPHRLRDARAVTLLQSLDVVADAGWAAVLRTP